ncbi:glutaredoxin family protein [Paenibacillus radicis (ex Xue et al. 2023)]|uniref:Glutaredoxin family protein n=1 Tax=Paenibacillus radicis (ex Xue et al. 2023) TaxID=2972489 RepID=A0ABT1YPF1_9BACL|nr:glutaredoxin family protein [Paenibacillus radicis (ex Xue et al. 2023)]MCR8635057.1 glutaredoxin family protein [Paenibacillus radicis (ex Xue et al. 2023)]
MSTATQVIVYSSNTCTYCKQLKQYLNEQSIAFEERNIDTNDAFIDELQATVIGDTRILGMNTTRIQKALAQ